jgi:hypothetical protein
MAGQMSGTGTRNRLVKVAVLCFVLLMSGVYDGCGAGW